MPRFTSPIQKNAELSLEISTWHPKGMGIGYLYSFPILVIDAIPGEAGIVRIVKVTPQHAFGKWIERNRNSPYRIEPSCPVAGRCGGCQLLHVSDAGYEIFKREIVGNSFQKYELVIPSLSYFPAPTSREFRNQGRFSTELTPDGDLKMGLFGLGNQSVIDFGTSCMIQHPLTDLITQKLREIHLTHPIYPSIQSIVTRVSFKGDQILVGFSGPALPDSLKAIIIEKLRLISKVSGIVYWQTETAAWSVFGHQEIPVWGNLDICETVGKFSYRYGINSFFQSNPLQAQQLIERVLVHLDQNAQSVLDLYCGVGLFSIPIAAMGKSVLGVESNASAINYARQNAKANSVQVEFEAMDAAEFPTGDNRHFDVLVVDPPRTGLSETVRNRIKQVRFRQIIYVSCNPETLASDLADLCQTQYELTGVDIVDMFPGSYHTETVAILISRA